MLKLIKQDIEEEKEKFKERIQGAEISLFIENIFSVDFKKPDGSNDNNTPASLVKNVIAKKMLIERLQEKCHQRLDIINNLLASHIEAPHTEKDESTPGIVKNSIKMINPNFGKFLLH